MPDFNRSEMSAAPASIAINMLLDVSARANAEKTRNYLGASAVGHPCLRKVQFDWLCDPAHSSRLHDIFTRGHFFEQQTREHFATAGFRFADKNRLEFEALDGWLRGHADGIFIAGPDIPGITYPCLWEHKAINTKGWRSLERDGLAKHYPQYAVQVALYQRYLGVDENPAIFTATNADTCDRLHILVPFDAEQAEAATLRAAMIIKATQAGELLPRMTNDSSNWRCRLCGHHNRCWRQ
jgi:hypothetical protein